MNYLAHLHLAADNAPARIGNLLGDFLKPSHAAHLPAAMRDGMRLHLFIDHYTDTHPIVLASKKAIASERQRYAGILLDIFYDHFLAKHWPQFHPSALPDFSQQVYRELTEYHTLLPPRLQDILPNMIRNDWLTGYRDLERIEQVLAGFAKHRIKRSSAFAGGIDDLHTHYSQLENDFLRFYPELIAAVQRVS
jgi:acyl carrier protein phosphodiesterase